MTGEEVLRAIAGGVLLGAAAGAVLLLNGRIAGVSGMLSSLVRREGGEHLWQPAFLAGLVAGGALLAWADPAAIPRAHALSPWLLALAGALVGFGARTAGGCTSGHGLCGVSRLAPRSVAATALFVLAGAAAVALGRVLP